MCSENWPFFLLLWVGWVEGFNINVDGMQEDLNAVHRFDRKLKFYLWYASHRTQRLIDQSEDVFVEHPVCVISVAVLVLLLNNAYGLSFFWSLLCFTKERVYFYFSKV